ncbi:hypothetical protein Hanom_Chr08g00718431 [Helianthus anomalus]
MVVGGSMDGSRWRAVVGDGRWWVVDGGGGGRWWWVVVYNTLQTLEDLRIGWTKFAPRRVRADVF